MSYSYSPKYKLLIANVDPTATRITALREVRSLQSLTCNVTTDPTVGTLTATWADTDFSTFGDTVSRPKPMVLVQLQLADRQGQWGIAWTGVADSITRTVNFGQSKTYTLEASSPYKLFNITLQSASAATGFAMDYAFGVKGTAVLQFAAKACNYPGAFSLLPAATGWGYSTALNAPGAKGTIDYAADVGANTWGAISSSAFISPAQQTYSAILQSLVADTEIEFFFNELGQLIWRPLAYLNVTGKERIVQKDTILSHAFKESDQGVLTTVYVRYNMLQTQYAQGIWHAPSAMAAALQPRAMVFYTPWIINKQGADALAAALGLRYSGNMHTAQLTMVADPHLTVGTTIRVPKFPDLMPVDNQRNKNPKALATETTPWYFYYVYGLSYSLQVGGQWAMSLDLRYGRDEKLAFPYLNYSPYLQDFIPGPGTVRTPISRITPIVYDTDQNNQTHIGTPFAVSANPAQAAGTIVVDPLAVPPGSLVLLKDGHGNIIGEYTAVAGALGTLSAVVPSNPTEATQGFITIEQYGSYPTTDSGVNSGTGGSYTNPGDANVPGGSGGALPALGSDTAGDHVSQLWLYNGSLSGNDDCGPACVVRYLRNRTRRGQSGLPLAGSKHEQIAAVRKDIGHEGDTSYAELTAVLGKYGVVPTLTMQWAQVAIWAGESIVAIGGQPTPAAWPPYFLRPGQGHFILWMQDLSPDNLFNDPLAFDDKAAQADNTYALSSVQAVFQGALLLP